MRTTSLLPGVALALFVAAPAFATSTTFNWSRAIGSS